MQNKQTNKRNALLLAVALLSVPGITTAATPNTKAGTLAIASVVLGCMLQGGYDGRKARGITRGATGAKRTGLQSAKDFLAGAFSVRENANRKLEELKQAFGKSQTKTLPESFTKRLWLLVKANPAIELGLAGMLVALFSARNHFIKQDAAAQAIAADLLARKLACDERYKKLTERAEVLKNAAQGKSSTTQEYHDAEHARICLLKATHPTDAKIVEKDAAANEIS